MFVEKFYSHFSQDTFFKFARPRVSVTQPSRFQDLLSDTKERLYEDITP